VVRRKMAEMTRWRAMSRGRAKARSTGMGRRKRTTT